MLKIIYNTIEIICRSSGSCGSIVLSERDSSYEVLAYYYDKGFSPNEINQSIINSLKKERLSLSEQTSSKVLTELLRTENLKSFYFLPFRKLAENGTVYALLLLSPKVNFYTKSKVKTIDLIAGLLQSQLETIGNKDIRQGNHKPDNATSDEYKNKLENVKKIAGEFIFLLNKEGYFAEVNPYGASSLDYDAAEIIGRHFTDLVSRKEQANSAKSFQQILKKKKQYHLKQYLSQNSEMKYDMKLSVNHYIKTTN